MENESCAWRFRITWDKTLRDCGYVAHDHHNPHDMGSACMARTAHRHPLGDAVGMSGVPTEHSAGPSSRRSRSLSVMKLFPRPEPLG
jgi:hypothetical protein